MNRSTSAFFVLGFIFFSPLFISDGKLDISGVWKVVEVQTVKSDNTISSVYPTESQVIFTQNNYSFCWTSHTSVPRTWLLSDSVKLARMNQSVINTGTFELKDSVLYTKAVFAMHPMFVNGEARFRCSYNGDTLMLTGLSVFSSEKIPHPVYAGGSHFVTKLLRTATIR